MSGKTFHKDRTPHMFLEYGKLSVKDSTFLFTTDSDSILIPAQQFTTLFLGPGTSVSHSAMKLSASSGCMINWVGEEGVRFYAAGLSDTSRTDRLWKQAEQALNKNKRLSVARRMYSYRFGLKSSLASYSLPQLSGMEAGRVKTTYNELAELNGVTWEGRSFDEIGDSMKARINLAVSTANSCLYGLAHAAIVSMGYTPAIGFIHGKTPFSFVYDVADLIKFQTVTKIAFEVASNTDINDVSRETRIRCRNMFKIGKTLKKLIPVIDYVISYDKNGIVERDAILPPFEFWSDVSNKS